MGNKPKKIVMVPRTMKIGIKALKEALGEGIEVKPLVASGSQSEALLKLMMNPLARCVWIFDLDELTSIDNWPRATRGQASYLPHWIGYRPTIGNDDLTESAEKTLVDRNIAVPKLAKIIQEFFR